MTKSTEKCSICDKPLDDDNCYGTKDFPLCRYHQGRMTQLLNYFATGKIKTVDEVENIRE
jgi:hypothetical protein